MAEFEEGDMLGDICLEDVDVNSTDFQNDLKEYNESMGNDTSKDISIQSDGTINIGGTPREIVIDGKSYSSVSDIREATKDFKKSAATDFANSLDGDDALDAKANDLTDSICGEDCSDPARDKIKDTVKTQITSDSVKAPVDPKNFASEQVLNDFTNSPSLDTANNVVNDIADKQGINAADYDKKVKELTEPQKEQINKMIDDKINNTPDPKEKSFWESVKETLKDNWGKIALAGLGMLLLGLYATALSNANSGCFVTTTDKNQKVSTCKYLDFTCKSDYKAGNSPCGDTSNYICDNGTKDNPKTPACSINDACTNDNNSNGISNKCSNAYMKTSVNGNTYDYEAIVCDLKCSLGSIVKGIAQIINKVIDVTGNTIDDITKIFTTIIKYFIYIVIGIAILMILYYGYKYFSKSKEEPATITFVQQPTKPSG